MTCRECGRSLEPGTRFCPACGMAVDEAACPSCGTSLPVGARFCPACGAVTDALAPSPSATDQRPRRERKVATILFADLAGFTALNESNDPELVQALVARAFDRLSDEIHRYDGTLEKFAGDAVLALFGVPAAHEDDPERAVRAALEMQARMAQLGHELRSEGRPELHLRVGIETGEVLVDLARASSERDRIVTGDAVNTAARLQQGARPAAVVVGPATYAATRLVIEYEELPPAALKGKELPVAGWQALAVKARRGGVRAPLGLEAPLIGRDEELALLKETLRRAVAEGRPHLATVLGSAGVGKSRLTWELEKYLDGLPETYHWRKGRCLAYGQPSYGALADLVRIDAAILDDDAPSAAAAKLQARLEALGIATRSDVRDGLDALLGLGDQGGLGRDELFEAWRHYLEAIAGVAPLVLVLEDIHWADDGTLDFVEFLARWAEAPILLLVLARHELLERRPAWSGGIPNASTIVLEPLDERETSRLVDGLVSGSLPPDVRQRIVESAGGNPLFGEELVRMLVDRGSLRFADGRWQLAHGVEDLEIPGSVQAVLAARLDTLPGAEKRLAQDAAVVGRIFWDALVAELEDAPVSTTRDLLRRLRVKELVVPREPSSLSGMVEFGFRHVLIRDVAYETLPKRERASRHLRVARWAESRLGERQEELVEVLASHYRSALAYAEEFGGGEDLIHELREKTVDYAVRAGHRARRLWELESATRWLRTAVDQARRLGLPPLERARLIEEYLRAGATGYEAIDPILESSAEGLSLLESLPADDEVRHLRSSLRNVRGAALYFAGRPEEANILVRDGIAELEGPPTRDRAALLGRLGWLSWRGGPAASAVEPLRRAIDEAAATGAEDVRRTALHDLGITLIDIDFPAGFRMLEESFVLAEAAGDIELLTRCRINIPSILAETGGDLHRAAHLLEEGLSHARRAMDRMHTSWLVGLLGWVRCMQGRFEEAVAAETEAAALAEAIGDRVLIRQQHHARGWVLAMEGRLGEAREAFEMSRRASDEPEPQQALWEAASRALLDWQDDGQDAVRKLGQHVATVMDTSPGGYEETCRWLARMALRTGQEAELERAGTAMERLAREGEGPAIVAEAGLYRTLRSAAPEQIGQVLSGTVSELETLGRVLQAADAVADAAIAVAQAGGDAGRLVAEAQARYLAMGARPILGELPEQRWYATTRTSAARPS